MHEFVASLVAVSHRHADRGALQCDGQMLTYGELFEQARCVAIDLQSQGVKPGDRVAFWGRRGICDYVHVLAIWMVGAAYVPLGTLYGVARNASILVAARVVGVLFANDAQDSAIAIGEALDLTVVSQTGDEKLSEPLWGLKWEHRSRTTVGSWFVPWCEPPTVMDDVVAQSDLAYLIFTSGSTGEPKGVPIGFEALGAYLDGMQSLYPLTADDRVSQMAQLSFDASIHEIYWTWRQGACLCVIPDRGILMWPRYVQDQQITSMLLVPSSVHLAARAGVLQRTPLPSLRCVFLGAELVTDQVIALLHSLAPASVLVNLWGPTESTVAFTHYRINLDEPLFPVIPIGKPLPGQRVKLFNVMEAEIDAQGDSDAQIGEILQSGNQVMQGYWQQAELNAERFVVLNGERWYKSGDLARWDPVHGYWFMGRKDRQVKIKGYRVELDAVETVLRSVLNHPELVIIVSANSTGQAGERLVCFMTRNAQPSSDELSQMAAKLGPYMVPSVFKLMDALPLSPSGKVDYKALAKLTLTEAMH